MVYDIRNQLVSPRRTTYLNEPSVPMPRNADLELLIKTMLSSRGKTGLKGKYNLNAIGGPVQPDTAEDRALAHLIAASQGNKKALGKVDVKALKPDLVPLYWQMKRSERLAQMPEEEGGVLNWVFDQLSRPSTAIASYGQGKLTRALAEYKKGNELGAFKEFILGNPKESAQDLWRGFSLKDKREFIDYNLQNYETITGKPAEGWTRKGLIAGGLAEDIFLDPTTYIGLGAVKSVGKTGLKAANLLKLSDESKKIAADLTARGLQAGDTNKLLAKQQKLYDTAEAYAEQFKQMRGAVGDRPRTLGDISKDTPTKIKKTAHQLPANLGELQSTPEEIFRYLGGERFIQPKPIGMREGAELRRRGALFGGKNISAGTQALIATTARTLAPGLEAAAQELKGRQLKGTLAELSERLNETGQTLNIMNHVPAPTTLEMLQNLPTAKLTQEAGSILHVPRLDPVTSLGGEQIEKFLDIQRQAHLDDVGVTDVASSDEGLIGILNLTEAADGVVTHNLDEIAKYADNPEKIQELEKAAMDWGFRAAETGEKLGGNSRQYQSELFNAYVAQKSLEALREIQEGDPFTLRALHDRLFIKGLGDIAGSLPADSESLRLGTALDAAGGLQFVNRRSLPELQAEIDTITESLGRAYDAGMGPEVIRGLETDMVTAFKDRLQLEIAGLYRLSEESELPMYLSSRQEHLRSELGLTLSVLDRYEAERALRGGLGVYDAQTFRQAQYLMNQITALEAVMKYADEPGRVQKAVEWAETRVFADALTEDELLKYARGRSEIADLSQKALRLLRADELIWAAIPNDPFGGKFVDSRWLKEYGFAPLFGKASQGSRAGYNVAQAVIRGSESAFYQKATGDVKDFITEFISRPEYKDLWMGDEFKGVLNKTYLEGLEGQHAKDIATLMEEILAQDVRTTVGFKVGGQVVLPLFSFKSGRVSNFLRLRAANTAIIGHTVRAYDAMFRTASKVNPDIAELKGQVYGAQERYLNSRARSYRKNYRGLSRADRRTQYDQVIIQGSKVPMMNKEGKDVTAFIDKEIEELAKYFYPMEADGYIHDKLYALNRWLPSNRRLNLTVNESIISGHNKATARQTLDPVSLLKAAIGASEDGLGSTKDLPEILWQMRVAQQKVIARNELITGLSDFGVPKRFIVGQGTAKGDLRPNKVADALIRDHGYRSIDAKDLMSSDHDLVSQLEGWVFDPKTKDDMIKVIKMTAPGKTVPDGVQAMVTGYNTLQRMWKKLVTQYNVPGYYVRNSISDFFMNFLNGVGPKAYWAGAHVLRFTTPNHMHPEWEKLPETIHSPHLPREAFPNASQEGRTIFRLTKAEAKAMGRGKNTKISAAEAWAIFVDKGLNSSQFHEDFREVVGSKFVGRGTEGARAADAALTTFNTARDDYFRISHFISSTRRAQSHGHSFEDAIEIAARDVRKYLFDYSDFTTIEKAVFSKIIPFYKWMRKSIPLTLQALVTDPGKVAAYPKLMNAISEMAGYENEEGLGLIPNAEMIIPSFFRDKALVPIGERYGDTVYFGLSNPTVDTLQMANTMYQGRDKPMQSFLDILMEKSSPFLKAPIELSQGKKMTGAPITSSAQYASDLLGPISSYRKLFGEKLPNESVGYEGNEQFYPTTYPVNPAITQQLGLTTQANTNKYQRAEMKRRLEAAKAATAARRKEQGIRSPEQQNWERYPWN